MTRPGRRPEVQLSLKHRHMAMLDARALSENVSRSEIVSEALVMHEFIRARLAAGDRLAFVLADGTVREVLIPD